MTVLRGQVAVIRPDGSAVRAGDEIRTLSETGALITFFIGTEIELGEQTILVVERVSRQGERVDVSLRQVFGATLNRVQTFADPGSSYRINAGGAVAVVRGTTFLLLGPTSEGAVVLVCLEDCDSRTTFVGVPLAPFMGYWAEVARGRVVQAPRAFRPEAEAGYWNAAFAGASLAEQVLQGDTNGRPAGQVPGGQQEEIRADEDDDDDDDKGDNGSPPGGPGPRATRTPTPTQILTATPTSTLTATPTLTLAPTSTPTEGIIIN